VEFSIEDLYNLTLPPEDAKSRNYLSKVIISYEHPEQTAINPISTITAPVHNLTHIDLPWLVSERRFPFRDVMPDISDDYKLHWNNIINNYDDFHQIIKGDGRSSIPMIDDYIKSIDTNFMCECVIINLDRKRNKFIKYLKDNNLVYEHYSSNNNFKYLNKNVEQRHLVEMLRDYLHISSKSILSIDDKYKLENKFVLFQTGWDEFIPEYEDWDHPVWMCWHLFLMYPYLDFFSATELIRSKCIGVGTDTISIECPLYYTHPKYRLSDIQALLNDKSWQSNKICLPFDNTDINSMSQTNLLPAHSTLFFSNSVFDSKNPFKILSSLTFSKLSKILKKFNLRNTIIEDDYTISTGNLFIMPLFTGLEFNNPLSKNIWTGLPCLVYFVG